METVENYSLTYYKLIHRQQMLIHCQQMLAMTVVLLYGCISNVW